MSGVHRKGCFESLIGGIVLTLLLGGFIRYMLWSMHIKQGAISSLMLMFLGEVSSVFFNPWLAARDYKKISGGKSTVRSLSPAAQTTTVLSFPLSRQRCLVFEPADQPFATAADCQCRL